MVGKFEEQYYDQLRAIERAIHGAYQQYPDLVDFQVDKVLEGLVRYYNAEINAKREPKLRFDATETAVWQRVKQICELHMGRDADVLVGDAAISVEDMVACLKRIRKSVSQMGGKGKQSYLDFLQNFFQDD